MAIEIERKFLLKNDDWKHIKHSAKHYQQAYFCNTSKVSVRVRLSDQQAWVSFKSATKKISRFEYEYEIPHADAVHMMAQFAQGAIIKKIRHFIPIDQHIWEIDVFEGDNQGLIVAEIELNSVDEYFAKPQWVGEEVSNDERYFNSHLVLNPFKNW